MGHDVAVAIGRSRQTLRTRHHRWRIVSRTSNRAGGRRRSDANPCPGTNQEQRGDGTTEQDNLAHVNSGRYATRREYSIVLICGFGMCLKSHDAQQCTVQCALAKRIDLRPSDFRISGFRNAAPDQKFGIRFVGPFRRASNSRSLARLGGARAQAALLSILNFKLE